MILSSNSIRAFSGRCRNSGLRRTCKSSSILLMASLTSLYLLISKIFLFESLWKNSKNCLSRASGYRNSWKIKYIWRQKKQDKYNYFSRVNTVIQDGGCSLNGRVTCRNHGSPNTILLKFTWHVEQKIYSIYGASKGTFWIFYYHFLAIFELQPITMPDSN